MGLKFYVIGDPIDHSLSPMMQNFFLKKFQINGTYHARPVKLNNLSDTIKSFIAEGVTGINITTPHKKNVLKFIDKLTPEAQIIGSVNTIKFDDDRLIGHNTDAIGFQASLRVLNCGFKGKNAIIFGAGGAARAIVVACSREQCRRIAIANRTFQRADKIVQEFAPLFPAAEFDAIPFDCDELNAVIKSSHLLVNATTVGMSAMKNQSVIRDVNCLHENLMVYDLIYRPAKTKLIQQARTAGTSWINGLDMLILQGIESLKFWTGQNVMLDKSSYRLLKKMLWREVCQE